MICLSLLMRVSPLFSPGKMWDRVRGHRGTEALGSKWDIYQSLKCTLW